MNDTQLTYRHIKPEGFVGDGRLGSTDINVSWGLAKRTSQHSKYARVVAQKRASILRDRDSRAFVEAEKNAKVTTDQGDYKVNMKEGHPSHGSIEGVFIGEK